MAGLSLEHLRQLVVIQQCGTISEAATRLCLTQPSLSRSMQRMEQQLGCTLFERTPNSVRLSDEGRLALQFAQDVLEDEAALRAVLADMD